MVFVEKWDSSIQKTLDPVATVSLIFCPRCILNSSLTFLEGVQWSIGLPSFLYDLFILCIVLYAVLGDIPLMLNIPDNDQNQSVSSHV